MEKRLEIIRVSPLRAGLVAGAALTGIAFLGLMLVSLLFVIDPGFDYSFGEWLLGGLAVAVYALLTSGLGGFAGGVAIASAYNGAGRLAGGLTIVLRDADVSGGGRGGTRRREPERPLAGPSPRGEETMRKEIARISPLRAGIISAAVIAVVYLVVGLLMLVFGGLMGGMQEMQGFEGMGGMHAWWMAGGGILALVMGIVMGAIIGFISGVLSALVYNVAAGIVGGVVIELRDA